MQPAAPFADKILAENIDAADRGIVTANQVNIRSAPDLKSDSIDQLGLEVVKIAGDPDPATRQTIGGTTDVWWPIITYQGKKGYIFGKYLRRWNGYQARFEQSGGEWKLVRFAPRQD